ncbi:MAG TPA: hypothetical protein VNW06_07075 [Cytophagaceae bacterium]|jgi:hypothetical protein|nr:hypothetical protein [Cytophagaceae bacterium]
MRQGNILAYILYCILFFLLQILFFRNIILFGYALCFVYIGYILMLPIAIKPIPLMLISLCFGLLMDSFFYTAGMNAFACVLIAYIRPYILNLLTPAGGYDASAEISISYMGFVWFIKYAALLIFIHHFLLFSMEAWNIKFIVGVFIRSIFSTIFTLFVLVLLQYLIKRADRY